MKLGLSMMPLHGLGKDITQAYEEDIEAIRQADRLGYSEAWIGEHYTSTTEGISSPLIFISHLLPQTSNIVLATGVLSLPYHHPAMAAAHVALVDRLAHGRFMLGIGAGSLVTDIELLGQAPAPVRMKMALEALTVMQRLWTETPPYAIEGEFYTLRSGDHLWPDLGCGALVTPYGNREIPVAMSGSSPNSGSMTLCGEKGWIPISANFVAPWSVRTHWEYYARGAEAAGRPADPAIWRVARSIHVAETDAEAEEFVMTERGPFLWYFDYMRKALERTVGTAALRVLPGDEPAQLTGEKMVDSYVLRGSVETVVQKILDLREEIGDFGTLISCAHDWTERGPMQRSMDLLAREVMPRVNARLDRSHLRMTGS